jgi:hypothetical protein
MADGGVERLEAALSRLEAALNRPAPEPTTDATATARSARLEAATRDAIARIDRLLAPAT